MGHPTVKFFPNGEKINFFMRREEVFNLDHPRSLPSLPGTS
jgi:hypothetical protein